MIQIPGGVEHMSVGVVVWILLRRPQICDAFALALPLYYLIAALGRYDYKFVIITLR